MTSVACSVHRFQQQLFGIPIDGTEDGNIHALLWEERVETGEAWCEGTRRSWGASTLSLVREARAFLEPSPPTHAAGFYSLRVVLSLCLHFFRLRKVSSTVSVAFRGP